MLLGEVMQVLSVHPSFPSGSAHVLAVSAQKPGDVAPLELALEPTSGLSIALARVEGIVGDQRGRVDGRRILVRGRNPSFETNMDGGA